MPNLSSAKDGPLECVRNPARDWYSNDSSSTCQDDRQKNGECFAHPLARGKCLRAAPPPIPPTASPPHCPSPRPSPARRSASPAEENPFHEPNNTECDRRIHQELYHDENEERHRQRRRRL